MRRVAFGRARVAFGAPPRGLVAGLAEAYHESDDPGRRERDIPAAVSAWVEA